MKHKIANLERELKKQRKGRRPMLPLFIEYVIGHGYVLSGGTLRELGIKHPEAQPERFELWNRDKLDRVGSSLLLYLPSAYIMKPGDPLIDHIAPEPNYNGDYPEERAKYGDYLFFKGEEPLQQLIVFYFELQPETSLPL